MKIENQLYEELFSKKDVNLKGFSSCSFSKDCALNFALKDMKED